MESLAKLKPAFKKDGSVTAGNASSVNDGAACVILMSERKMKQLGLTPMGEILSIESYGVEPRVMGIGPAYAVPKALARAGLTQADIGVWEINEAFASQFLAVNRELKIDPGQAQRARLRHLSGSSRRHDGRAHCGNRTVSDETQRGKIRRCLPMRGRRAGHGHVLKNPNV
jgi:acetyl-CoA acetyltransferase